LADPQRAVAAPTLDLTGAPHGRLVDVPAGGANLRARLYAPAGDAAGPAVVMTHGLSATITGMAAERYAEAIAAAGVTALLLEHRGFGLSGGEPRHVLNRWLQMADYRHGLDVLTGLPGVDPARLGVWGDSMSGGAALAVASFDDRVRTVVAQVPACGSTPPPDDPDGHAFATLRELYLSDGWRALETVREAPMPVVSPDHPRTPSILEPVTAYRWFMEYGRRPGTGWVNEAVLEQVLLPVPYHPGLCVPHLRAASLWVVAEDDEMPGAEPDVTRRCFEIAGGEKAWLGIGGGHFGLLYDPSALLDRVSAAEAAFLARVL
jgi:hypothetical protein